MPSLAAWRGPGRAACWLLLCGFLAGCNQPQAPAGSAPPAPTPVDLTPAAGVPGNPNRGRALFIGKGCGGCHTINGQPGAVGVTGPNLTNVTVRPTIAGLRIPNTPLNMQRWLLNPAAMKPGTAMPDVGLSQAEARDISAYLYALPETRR